MYCIESVLYTEYIYGIHVDCSQLVPFHDSVTLVPDDLLLAYSKSQGLEVDLNNSKLC